MFGDATEVKIGAAAAGGGVLVMKCVRDEGERGALPLQSQGDGGNGECGN